MAISTEQLPQAIPHEVATAAQQWHEATAQMQQEIGTLRAQVQDAAQAAPLPQEMTTSLVDTRVLGKRTVFSEHDKRMREKRTEVRVKKRETDRETVCPRRSRVYFRNAPVCAVKTRERLECTHSVVFPAKTKKTTHTDTPTRSPDQHGTAQDNHKDMHNQTTTHNTQTST